MAEIMEKQRTEEPRVAEHLKHSEGPVALALEEQTAKLPSDIWLWGAVGSMGASAIMQLRGSRHASIFLGQWVAPLLLFGVYNKLVKIAGSDRLHRSASQGNPNL